MKVSILTGIVKRSVDFPGLRDMREVVTILHDCGYDTLDIGFTEQTFPDFILRGDDWQQKIDDLANTAAKLGVTFAQSHLPFIKKASTDLDPNWSKPGFPEYFEECMRRAYVASAMLGVPYGTTHPLTYLDAVGSPDLALERNRAYYEPFVEFGIKHNVGTAFENMRPESPQWPFPGRYCQNYDQLIELVDSFGDPMVGICWDSGHANQAGHDQGRAIRAMGGRLKNLHLNDNHYNCRDEHLLPYMGTVDWESVMSALVDIDYKGVLNYEVGKLCDNAPTALQIEWVKTARSNAGRILELYQRLYAQKHA